MRKSHIFLFLILINCSMAQAQQSVEQLKSYLAALRIGNNSIVPEAVCVGSSGNKKVWEQV